MGSEIVEDDDCGLAIGKRFDVVLQLLQERFQLVNTEPSSIMMMSGRPRFSRSRSSTSITRTAGIECAMWIARHG